MNPNTQTKPKTQTKTPNQAKAPAGSNRRRNRGTGRTGRPSGRSAGNGRSNRPGAQRRGGRTVEVTGTYSQHHRGFGFLALTDPISRGEHTILDAFVNPSLAATLVAGDTVTAQVSVSGDRASATRVTVTRRNRTHLFGQVIAATAADGATVLEVDVDSHVAAGRLHVDAGHDLTPGAWVYARIAPTATKTHLGQVAEVVETYPQLTPAALRRMTFARFDLDLTRSRRVTDDARAAAKRGRAALTGKVPAGRTDLRQVPTFTVDGASTRDLDDAISATRTPEGIRVQVHIADVAALVTPGSRLDQDAYGYATSVYLPGWNRPMLPPQLSEDVLSLLPGVPRDTLTVGYTVTPDGTLADIDVRRARIVSDARLTYTDASSLLTGGTDAGQRPAKRVMSALRAAHYAATCLGQERSARLALGERDRPLPEWEVTVASHVTDETADPYADATFTAATATESTLADEMIERLMVAANEAVATWLTDRNLPGVYRVHAAPGADLAGDVAALAPHLPKTVRTKVDVESDGLAGLAEIADELDAHHPTGHLVDVLLMRHLKRATYTADRGDHYGLGSTGYVHFTSPIRRYADLLVHRVIGAHLDADTDLLNQLRADMADHADHITAAAWNAARIESGFRRWATEQLFADTHARRRENTAGVVTGFSPAGAFVSAGTHGVSGILPFESMPGTWSTDPRKVAATDTTGGPALTLGSRVWVRPVAVDPGLVGVTWERGTRPARRGTRRRSTGRAAA